MFDGGFGIGPGGGGGFDWNGNGHSDHVDNYMDYKASSSGGSNGSGSRGRNSGSEPSWGYIGKLGLANAAIGIALLIACTVLDDFPLFSALTSLGGIVLAIKILISR